MPVPVFAIEEPIIVGQYKALKIISEQSSTKIIVDESFQRHLQFGDIQDELVIWILNVRVSKIGGLLSSLDIVQSANARHIPVIVGAHVGETSLLTRAALAIAKVTGDSLLVQEGAFGTYQLQHDICDEPLMLHNGGVRNARSGGG